MTCINKGVFVEEKIYAIDVTFATKNGRGKPYTYKSKEEIAPDTEVVCPYGANLKDGIVTGCKTDYRFNPNIGYKFIHEVKKKEQVVE
jgi:hypothetical protein